MKPPQFLLDALESLQNPEADRKWEIRALKIDGKAEWCLCLTAGEQTLPVFRVIPSDTSVSIEGATPIHIEAEGSLEDIAEKAQRARPIFQVVAYGEDEDTEVETWIRDVLDPPLIGIILADVLRQYARVMEETLDENEYASKKIKFTASDFEKAIRHFLFVELNNPSAGIDLHRLSERTKH